MNHDRDTSGTKLFEILKGSGYFLQMYDKYGVKTLKPSKANRFFATINNHDKAMKDLDNYSILVAVHDDGSTSSVSVKTPTSEVVGDKNFADIEQLVLYIRSAVGAREDLLVHWSSFNHTIKLKDEVVNNEEPNQLDETISVELLEFDAFMSQFDDLPPVRVDENRIDYEEVENALRTFDCDFNAVMSYLISIDSNWRSAYEDDPQNAMNTLKTIDLNRRRR